MNFIGSKQQSNLESVTDVRFSRIIWKNLARRPFRSGLTIVGLALAVAAVVALVGISRGFEYSFTDLYRHRRIDLVVQRTGAMMQLSSTIEERLASRVAGLPEVRRVIAALLDVVALEKFDLLAVLVNGWPADSPALRDIKVQTGRMLQAGDMGKVILGHVLAANTGKHVGDRIEIYSEQFEVVGIFQSLNVYENGAIFMLLPELQRLMDRPGQVSAILVQAKNPDDPQEIERLRKQIEKLSPNITATPVTQFVRNVSQIRVARVAAAVISGIAIVIGAIGVLNTMVMSVFERVGEIGTLRAIGWSKKRVIGMILGEATLLSGFAAAGGILLGVAIIRLIRYWPTVAGFVAGGASVSVILQGCIIALTMGLIGALYPAMWATRLWPVEALRRK